MLDRVRALTREKGFTLVELLVTTTIIGVLATIVTVNVTGASTSSQNKANITLVGQVQSGLDNYSGQNPSATGVPTTGTVGSADSTNYFGVSGTAGGVLVNASDLIIDFASTTNSFSDNFRLNNTAATFKCVVGSAITFALKACRN